MAVTTAAALAFAGLGAAQAIGLNSGLGSARDENRRRERITNRSLERSESRELASITRDFQRLLGAVEVSASERGVSEATRLALVSEQRAAVGRALDATRINFAQSRLSSLLAFEQRDSELAAQRRSPLLAAVQGGIDGARLGTQLETALNDNAFARRRLDLLRSETSQVGLVNTNIPSANVLATAILGATP